MDGSTVRVPVEGGYLSAVRSGSGPPAILCHGGPGLWDYTARLAALVEDETTIVRFDQRGCGRSKCGGPYTLQGAIADLDAVRDFFEIESPVLIGHSWGGTLCLAYALRHPSRVRGLVYLSGVGTDRSWHDIVRRRRRALFTEAEEKRVLSLVSALASTPADAQEPMVREYCQLAWPVNFANPEFGKTQIPALVPTGAHMNLEAGALADETSEAMEGETFEHQLEKLAAPVLVVHGLSDVRPYQSAQRLADALPNGRFVGLEGVGHFADLEDPAKLSQELRGFLRGLPP